MLHSRTPTQHHILALTFIAVSFAWGASALLAITGLYDQVPSLTLTARAAGDMWVYQDSIVSPWAHASWAGTTDYANTEQVYAGTKSAKVSATAWGGVSFQAWSNPQDFSGYTAMKFAVYPTTTFTAGINLNGPNGFVSTNVSKSLTANQWNVISINVSSFSIPSGQLVDRINIGNDSQARTYYVDNVEFIAAAGIPDTAAPSAPMGLSVTVVSATQLNLTWTAATDNVAVTGYRVYRAGTQIATTATTSYQNTGLIASTTYTYAIAAYDAAGNVSSQSSTVSASTPAALVADTTPPTVALTAPIGGATVSGSVVVSANASDNVGVSGVQFKLDGSNVGAEDTTSPYSYTWDTSTATNGSHAVTATARDAAGNTTTATAVTVTTSNLAVTPPPPVSSSNFWVTAYYPTWAMMPLGAAAWAIPPDAVDWTGITHVVQFFGYPSVDSTTAPYFKALSSALDAADYQYNARGNGCQPPATCAIDYQHVLITSAHAKGTKVFLDINAVDAAPLNAVASDPAKVDVFVDAVVSYASQKGYDGIEIDWESWITPLPSVTVTSNLLTKFRARMNQTSGVKLLVLAPQSGHQNNYDPAVVNATVDQINMQEYDLDSAWNDQTKQNGTWFINPLHLGTDYPAWPAWQGRSIDTRGPLQWVAAGYNPKIVGMGLAVYGDIFRNTNGPTLPFSPTKQGAGKYQELMSLLSNGGTLYWDDVRKANYIQGTALFNQGNPDTWGAFGVKAGEKFWASIPTAKSFQEDIDWARTNSLGGIMLYDITEDLDASKPFGQRNPLHNSVVQYVAGSVTPPPSGDTTPPTVSLTAPAASATVSGSVTLSATASDNVGVVGVQFKVDGSNLGAEDTSSPYTLAWDSTTVPNGSHIVAAVARDAAGNSTFAAPVTLTVSNTTTVTPPPSGGGGGGGSGSGSSGGGSSGGNSGGGGSVIPPKSNRPTTPKTSVVTAPVVQPTPASLLEEVQQLRANSVTDQATAVGTIPSTTLEQHTTTTILPKLISTTAQVSVASRTTILSFVTYGTPSTVALGSGERAGVVSSFTTAFSRLPQTEADWNDVLKLATGHFPAQQNTAKEQSAAVLFKQVYLRAPQTSNTHDQAAITIMAYGLRVTSRNLKSEQAALTTFKFIFRRLPKSTTDWDALRAIAYSGAKR